MPSPYLDQPQRSLDDVLRKRPLNRRSLLTRALAGAAGAAIGTTAAMPTAKAAAQADTELLALLDEEDRLWEMVSSLQDEAQRRGRHVPEVRVEVGRQTVRGGEVEPIYAENENEWSNWFDPDYPPEQLQMRVLFARAMGRDALLYEHRRNELLSEIRQQAAARAKALRSAGVDDLQAKAESYIAQASALSEKIDKLRPATIEAAIRLIETEVDDRKENAIAGLRAISAKMGVA